MALTIFAFNNTPQQYAIREAGGIKYSVFEPFLNSSIEYDVCYAAFQVTIILEELRNTFQDLLLNCYMCIIHHIFLIKISSISWSFNTYWIYFYRLQCIERTLHKMWKYLYVFHVVYTGSIKAYQLNQFKCQPPKIITL